MTLLINPFVFSAPSPTGDPFLTSAAAGSLRNNFDGCVGFRFATPASPVITVTALGRWKVSGNNQSHTISIKLADGTVVASAVVNLAGGTVDEYNYTAITPVALTPSVNYFLVSSEVNGGDQWHDLGVYTDSGVVTLEFAAFQTGCAGAPAEGSVGQSYVPVNMKLQ